MLYQKIRKPATPAFLAPSLANWVVAQAAILLLWSPWLPTFLNQANAVYRDFWLPAPGWDAVRATLVSLLNASTPVRGETVDAGLLVIPFALMAGLGLVAFRKKLSQFVFLLCLFAVPILAELVVSLRRPILSDRTLVWITIPLLVALAAGIKQLRFRPLMLVALMALASINLFSVGDYFRHPPRQTWQDAAGFVSLFAEPHDLLLFNTPRAQFAFDYYFRDFEARYGARMEKHGVPVDALDGGGVEPKMTENDIPHLASLLQGRTRAWLIYSHAGYTDPQQLIPQTISARMKLVTQRDFYGGQIRLYEAP
jgi:hypothetical protein